MHSRIFVFSANSDGAAFRRKLHLQRPHSVDISVVVPAYNEEKLLSGCLVSLEQQMLARSRYEIIVVDNASTDATASIARRFDVRLVSEPIKGVARARQAGASAAHGEIIAATDADARPPHDWLVRIAQAFEKDPGLGGLTGPVYCYDGKWIESSAQRFISNGIVHLTFSLRRSCFSGNNFAVRRKPFWQVGGFNITLRAGEDADLGLRMSAVTRLAYHPGIEMYISARRTREGYWKVASRAIENYIRLLLLHLPPTDYTDIR